MTRPESLIPKQHTGISKEIHHEFSFRDSLEARAAFVRVKARLLDVNDWASTAEGISAKFQLCDNTGQSLSRSARQGDLVCIDMPGPHRLSDSGYDWVMLPTVEEGEEGEGNPWIVLTTRPCQDPTSKSHLAETAHFFSERSTGTFIFKLEDLKISGSHYGRNERPNTDGSLIDLARAVVVSFGAYLGLSDVQWSNLVKGILEA